MAEKIFPDSSKPLKPTTVNPAAAATATVKPQLHNTPRPLYRPHPHRIRRRSSYCYFYSCLWIIFILLLLTVSAAVASGVLFLIYRPHHPSFSISDLQIHQFNLNSSNKQTDFRFNLTVTAINPNKHIAFYYDAVSVSISISSGKIVAGDGTIPAFATAKRSSVKLKTDVRVDDDDNGGFRSDLKEKNRRLGLGFTIEMDSKVKVKIGRRVSEIVPIRVVCGGVKEVAVVAAGGSPATAVVSNSKCKVDFRIRIWKWTIWR